MIAGPTPSLAPDADLLSPGCRRCAHCGGTLYRERVPFEDAIDERCIQCGRDQDPAPPFLQPEPYEMRRAGHHEGDPIADPWSPIEDETLLAMWAAKSSISEIAAALYGRTAKAVTARKNKLTKRGGA